MLNSLDQSNVAQVLATADEAGVLESYVTNAWPTYLGCLP